MRFDWLTNNWGAIVAWCVFGLLAFLVWNAWTLPRRLKAKYRSVHCLSCDYDLRARTTDQCPECGQAIPFKQKRFLNKLNRQGAAR